MKITPSNPPSKPCEVCGKKYFKLVNQSNKNWNERSRFCSRSCGMKWRKLELGTGESSQFKKGDGRNLWWKERGMKVPPCAGWNKKYPNGAPLEVIREWRRKGMKKYRANAKNMQKVHARSFLNDRVRSGEIERLPCQKCGSEKSEAHHYKGYEKQNWLDVQWFCKKCHEIEHSNS